MGVSTPHPFNDDYDENWDGTGSVTRSDPFDDDEWAESWTRSQEEHRARRKAYWDQVTRRWVCTCPIFLDRGSCHHVKSFRSETVVQASEDYL